MLRSGFFNSVNGDRKYNAEEMGKYFDKIVGSGVFANPSTNLQVLESSGMNVKVAAGRGWIDCHWIDNDADYLIPITQSNMVYPRIDAIIMKLNLNENARTLTIEVKTGVAASNPSAPSMERSENIKEYCLATVHVGTNVNSITQADITDTRANNDVCGWVTSLVDQVDTSTLFKQWESAYQKYFDESTEGFEEYFDEQKKIFDDWFDTIKQNLSGSTLLREFSSRYVTTKENETDIPIGIPNYISGYDVLDVYINGLRLVKDVEFVEKNTYITLTNPLSINQPIEFVVFKSVDGKDALSVVELLERLTDKVSDLESRLERLEKA